MNPSIVRTAAVLIALAGNASATDPITLRGAAEYGGPVTPARISVDMSTLPRYPGWKPGDPIKEIPQRKGVPRDYVPPVTDPQPEHGNPLRAMNNRMPRGGGGPDFDVPLVNRDGGGFTGVNPPDTIGDVGNDYYIQMINGGGGVGGTRVLILDKTDGSTVPGGDFALSSLAVGSGTGCTNGSGDPIVMFDETVDNGIGQPSGRWFLSEFTGSSFCVYISQTADPTAGNWFLYEFGSASGALPDYPKWAVWPDAYYIGANEDSGIAGDGRTVYAFDRENMLLGSTVRPAQVFEIPELAGFGFQMAHPVDWDGRMAPPAGTPGLFVRHRDDEVHNGGASDPTQDFLEIWEFDVDWANPGNSTFSGPTDIGVQDFDSDLCGLFSFSCVPQPGSTTQLDPLREPVMWRAQYRNLGDREVIVGSWVTDVVGGNADVHGVQWAELRHDGIGWSLHQEGVVSPDNVNRWMSSIAMDGTGNIALGYNVSDDSTTFPGLRYIGRLASDPLGTMSRGEFTLVDGSGSNGSNRYGDYSALVVDPVDECTFWFTGEYNTSSQWSTRIGAFRFAACGEPGFVLAPDPAVGGVCTAGAPADFISDIEVSSVAGFNDAVTLAFDPPLPAGFGSGFSVNPVIPGGTSTATVTIDQTVAPGDYDLTVLGTASGAADRTAALRITVSDALPGGLTLGVPANGATDVEVLPTLQWTASAQAQSYLVEIATDAGFTNVVYSAVEADTVHDVATPLPFVTQLYWRVTPENFCGDAAPSATSTFTTRLEPGDCPVDAVTLSVFSDDMENGTNGWTLGTGGTQNTWQQTTANAVSGTTAWNAENVATVSDQRLISPLIDLPDLSFSPLTLRFQNRQEIEDDGGAACWDAAILEISDDGGSSWTQLQSEVLYRDFDGIVNNFSGGQNPLAGLPGWCGDPRDFEDYTIDLSDYAGDSVQLRFRFGTDGLVGAREGWTIDDVRVEACLREAIFADGFESVVPVR